MSPGVRSKPSILVMGEALVDVVTRGDDVDEHVGGSPANVAFGLGRLGHDVALATWIGADRRGKRIARACRRADVELVPGSDKAPRTSVANAEIDAEGHATYNFDLTWVLPTLPHISEVDHVHTGSIAATLEPGGTQVVGALKATHGEATISYDPNARPTLMGDPQDARNRVEEIVVLSDVVKVSDQDVEWFYPDRAIDDVVQDWLAMGPSLVVVTRGGEGATFAVRGADPVLARECRRTDGGHGGGRRLVHGGPALGPAGCRSSGRRRCPCQARAGRTRRCAPGCAAGHRNVRRDRQPRRRLRPYPQRTRNRPLIREHSGCSPESGLIPQRLPFFAGLCGFHNVVRFANVLVGEDARRLRVESSVGDLRRDVVPRHVGPVAFTLDGVTYEIDLSTKECQHTPRGVRALDRSRTARRGTAPKLDVSASRTATEPR